MYIYSVYKRVKARDRILEYGEGRWRLTGNKCGA